VVRSKAVREITIRPERRWRRDGSHLSVMLTRAESEQLRASLTDTLNISAGDQESHLAGLQVARGERGARDTRERLLDRRRKVALYP
jgi:hypothetical protein